MMTVAVAVAAFPSPPEATPPPNKHAVHQTNKQVSTACPPVSPPSTWQRFPKSLKTLGVLAVAIKNRTQDGHFEMADPEPALQRLADALCKHPRFVSPWFWCSREPRFFFEVLCVSDFGVILNLACLRAGVGGGGRTHALAVRP